MLAAHKTRGSVPFQEKGCQEFNWIPIIQQYLRQNPSTCKGFCRSLELLSTTTTTLNLQEALDGHFSTFAMPPTHDNEDHGAAIQLHCPGDVGDDGVCDDVGSVPLGRRRRQLSNHPTLFCDGDPVGHAVLGVLSSAEVSSGGGLPGGWGWSGGHQSGQAHARPRS